VRQAIKGIALIVCCFGTHGPRVGPRVGYNVGDRVGLNVGPSEGETEGDTVLERKRIIRK